MADGRRLAFAGAVLLPVVRAQPGELPAPVPSPGEVRDAAAQILRDPAYRASGPSVLERVLRWIGGRLDSLLPDQLGGSGGPGAVVVWVLVVLVLALALRAVVRSGWRPRRPRHRRDGAHDDLPEFRLAAQHDAAAWRAEAERLEAARAWRQAVHARYGELVAVLVERGVLVDVPGRTSGEYRAEFDAVTPVPANARAFARATDVFERAWYTDAPVDANDVATIRSAAADVLEPVWR
jgi:hypothetical protein